MTDEQYIQQLRSSIKQHGYNTQYVEKCIEYAQRLLINKMPVIFDTKHLALLIGINIQDLTKMVFCEELFYSKTHIPKKSGGTRELDIPSYDMKYIQRWILNNILYHVNVSESAVGFCCNKSIVDNAKKHLNQYCIVNMDIQDFFPSISFERVYRIFSYYGYTNEVSFILAKLCTFQNRLPQGSPASPYISNIVCLKLDARLSALAQKYESNYSRYADDLSFSGGNDIKSIIKPVSKILDDEGFRVNDNKTRIAYPYQRQEVTGLLVNGDTVRVSKKYKKDLFQELYYCLKFGVQSHMEKTGCDKTFFKEHIYGKIYFVNMVEPSTAQKMFEIASKIQWDY